MNPSHPDSMTSADTRSWKRSGSSVSRHGPARPRSPGYLGHTLQQAVAPDARYRYVNVAQWRSADDFHAAHGPGFRALVTQPGWEKFPSQPALYQVVNHAEAEGSPA